MDELLFVHAILISQMSGERSAMGLFPGSQIESTHAQNEFISTRSRNKFLFAKNPIKVHRPRPQALLTFGQCNCREVESGSQK